MLKLFKRKPIDPTTLPPYVQELEKMFRDPDQWIIPYSTHWGKYWVERVNHKYDKNLSLCVDDGYRGFTWDRYIIKPSPEFRELKSIPDKYRKYLFNIFQDTLFPLIIEKQSNYNTKSDEHSIQYIQRLNSKEK